jgi:hypothetical protein
MSTSFVDLGEGSKVSYSPSSWWFLRPAKKLTNLLKRGNLRSRDENPSIIVIRVSSGDMMSEYVDRMVKDIPDSKFIDFELSAKKSSQRGAACQAAAMIYSFVYHPTTLTEIPDKKVIIIIDLINRNPYLCTLEFIYTVSMLTGSTLVDECEELGYMPCAATISNPMSSVKFIVAHPGEVSINDIASEKSQLLSPLANAVLCVKSLTEDDEA